MSSKNRALHIRRSAIIGMTLGVAAAIAAIPAPSSALPAKNADPTMSVTIHSPDPETGKVRIIVRAKDVDSKNLRIHIPKQVPRGRLTWKPTSSGSASGVLTYTPTAHARHAAAADDAPSSAGFTAADLKVTDGEGGTTSLSIRIPVCPSNAAPTGFADVLAPNPATGVVTGTVEATDPDGDLGVFHCPSSTSKGTATINASTGAFTYTPTASARAAASEPGATALEKTDTFTVTITDGYGGTTAVPVTVDVAPLVN